MPMTQSEMIKLLKSHGWKYVKGGKGSHAKVTKQGHRSITIPKGELRKGTELAILKQAGLK